MPNGPDNFSLITTPWLPVRRRSGAVEYITPYNITHGIADDPVTDLLWPRPDFNAAAHEFLIGLLTTLATPKDEAEWQEQWLHPPTPEQLLRAMAPFAATFNLTGGGPKFMQDLDPLNGGKHKDVAALLIDTPGDNTLKNNADLFVKRGQVPRMCRAAAAMALYTLNTYAPMGGGGHLTSMRGGGPMTTLVIAEHPHYPTALWGRLWPNVETREQIAQRNTYAVADDDPGLIFPWLVDTRNSHPKQNGVYTTPRDVHPLQVYWGMPRRIQLQFDASDGEPCALTGAADPVMVQHYRTIVYGNRYDAAFRHPLTPYYRQKADTMQLPKHPNNGAIKYRHWPGLVVPSADGLRTPAQVIQHWPTRQAHSRATRFTAYGYDMKQATALAWEEAEMPLFATSNPAVAAGLQAFIQRTTTAAASVAALLISAVKQAHHDRVKDARGDYGHYAELFYRHTETAFYAALHAASGQLSDHKADDPTYAERLLWAETMAACALRLFDEHVSLADVNPRRTERNTRARFFLSWPSPVTANPVKNCTKKSSV